jgi:hypothetical protein
MLHAVSTSADSGSLPEIEGDEDDDVSLVQTTRASETLLTPGGQNPWQEPDSLVGCLLGERYKLERLIGQGGMGAVYLATHVIIGKQIAVKVLSPDYSRNPADVQRFLGEARAASLIRHDHVVDIADFGYSPQGQAYLVMEYLEGEDLAHTLQRVGRMPWFRVSNVIMQIGSALAAAHAKGIVHRDMKPENCFRVKREGDEDFIKVLDFGIAKITDDRLKKGEHSLTIEGGIIGTPEYIAPELCRGLKADRRVDIYALGIIMYRMLIGVVPFRTDTDNYMAVLSQHLTDPPKPFLDQAPDIMIPPKIEQIVMRALEKDPARRYQTVEELIAALREAQLTLTGASSTALITGLSRLPRARVVKRAPGMPLGLLLTLAALFVLGGGAIAWTVLGGGGQEPTHAPIAAKWDPPAAPPVVPPTRTPPTPPVPTPEPKPVIAATSTGGDPDGASAGSAAEEPDSDVLPDSLAGADFRRVIGPLQRSLASHCPGLPGFEVGLKIYVEASGKIARMVPEGRQAGSSFSACVVKLVRPSRFKKARKESVHSATFKL